MDPLFALLVVDDPTLCSHLMERAKIRDRLHVESCSSALQALELLGQRTFQILYAELMLEGMSGVELTQKVKQQFPDIHIILGASEGTARDVISAMQAGAAEFIVDPYESELIDSAFDKAISNILRGRSAVSSARTLTSDFITQDHTLLQVLQIARRVAPSMAGVLITGESGTGKELLASFIHRHSRRRNEAYVAINCAALPEQLAESELFGHEKGAFTGAIVRKIGKFESAENGSLVLDEITEMALPLQAKLLRALQEREIVRLGSNRPIPVDARVIAISNRNMKEAVRSGTFRKDLYYRLNVIPLTIPPLRERKSDIPLLADHFLKRFCSQNAKSMSRISDEAMGLLMEQPWPGNVRELENVIQRGVLIGTGETLSANDLILDESFSTPPTKPSPAVGMTVREMEKELIFNTLREVNENRTHAAKMLGISIRTLRNKLNEYRAEMGMPAE